MDYPEFVDFLDLPDHRETQERTVSREKLDLQDLKDTRVQREIWEMLVVPDHEDREEK